MPTVNKVTLIGYIGAEPEMTYSSKGTAITNISIGTNRMETTDWHRIVSFGTNAEWVNENTHKGDMVYIEGSVQYSTWTKQDGTSQKQTQIYADKVLLLKGRNPIAGTE